MPYVSRMEGAVSGVFQVVQPGYAEEWLDESADDIVAFIERWRGPSVPDRVSSRQFYLMLDRMDTTTNPGIYDQFTSWVALQPRSIRLVYEKDGLVDRTDATLQQGFAALGFTPEQIDAFFTAAAAL